MTVTAATSNDSSALGNSQWHAAVTQLHAALLRSQYLGVQRLPTERRAIAAPLEPLIFWRFAVTGRRQLLQPSAVPQLYRALAKIRHPTAVAALAFFGLDEPASDAQLTQLLAKLDCPATIDELLSLRLVARDQAELLVSRLRFIPQGQTLIVSDAYDRSIPDFTYLGRDSLHMAELLAHEFAGRRFCRGLDIGCGAGVQGLALARFADSVTGVDINPRAVAFANLNARLNGLQNVAHFELGDLATGVQGPFDIVLSNPPFMFMPQQEMSVNRDGYGGHLGLELIGRILADLDRLLGPQAEAVLLATSPCIKGTSLLESLVEQKLAGVKLGAQITYLEFRIDPLHYEFHRQHDIDYVIGCCVRVNRKWPPGVKVLRLNFPTEVANKAFVALSRWRRRAK